MRTVHYFAFFVGLLAVQACSAGSDGPPPFASSGRLSDEASAADEGDGAGYDDSDPSADEQGSEGEGELEGEEGSPLPPGSCTVSFDTQIFPKIQQVWRCGASQCHGAPGEHAPVMDTKDADSTYDLFITQVHAGKKLVDTQSTDPNASALFCLMQGTCGQRMPYQGVDAADLALVESWLKCGGKR